ncbi:NUDIX hydrolase [Sinorhizobium sp. 7-81]|uniref:NUDIX hydrolase n=1 Tax=unclassified Sinorhizobium TaxID=2613772 RepID=UPI0024C3F8DC|nr:NUDIX hydrolase [Sinorhizobium sp. 8-89]MDK1389926.1 NUDIX hydrolase [Sinorhizobium sp. 7-81]MDK1494457.1 NUDIX hydrolase [Sinorhizobium sp. 8-89]
MSTTDYLSKLINKAPKLVEYRQISQCGTICLRINEGNEPEVLLLTSRGTGRWIIPKGYLERNEQPHKCAKREALEEAGVTGKIGKKPIGSYTYIKDSKRPPHMVSVFLMEFKDEVDDFREKGQRTRRWVSPLEAADLVVETELQGLFRRAELNNKCGLRR